MPTSWPKWPTQNDHIRSHVVFFQAEHAAQAGFYGISGMMPSRASSTAIAVAAGSYMNGSVKTFGQSYITSIPAAAAGKHRYDLIILDCTDDSLRRVAGSEDVPTQSTDFLENLNPQPPELPHTACYLIAIICVDQNGVQSTNHGNYCTAGVMDCRLGGPGLHNQNTDQYLDHGGPNQCSVSDIADALAKRHTQAADDNFNGLMEDSGIALTDLLLYYKTGAGYRKVKQQDLLGRTMTRSLQASFDGGFGTAIQAGTSIDLHVKVAGTLKSWDIGAQRVAGQSSGSIEFLLLKCTHEQYDDGVTHPVIGDDITASDHPKIVNDVKGSGTSLTGWNTSLNAGDWIRVYVNSCSNLTKATIDIGYEVN